MSDLSPSNPCIVQPGDARALQRQLYREIGLSAVAAALADDLPAISAVAAAVEPIGYCPHVKHKAAA